MLPALEEWATSRSIASLATYLQSVDNKKFSRSIAIQREDIEDDIHGLYADSLRLLGEQSAKWKDQQLAAAIEANPTCYDGQPFFSAIHPVNKYDGTVKSRSGSTNQSNLFATTPLTPDNFAAVYQAMSGWVAENGKPLFVRPDTLLIPPELEYTARNILNATFIAPATVGGNAQVGANANVLNGMAEIVVAPELTSTTAWYLLATKRAVQPFVVQSRYEPDLVPLVNPSDPNVANLDEYVWHVRARGAFSTAIWWLAAKATP
jgi:phage major head subunit gpT-like protein